MTFIDYLSSRLYIKIMSVLVPIVLSAIVIATYALRGVLQATGLMPFDPYYSVLIILPLLLIVLKQFSFVDLGFRVGKPLVGIFFIILLPAILYVRFFLMGRQFIPFSGFPIMLLVGSFAEEFFFRGYLQEDLKKRFGGNIWLSLVATNIIFAVVHLVKGYSFVSAGMTGLIGAYFGITKDEQGGSSLFYSMAAHGLYNLVAIAVMPG